MTKIPRLSDRELKKWTGILGARKMKSLYIESKIYLTPAQLDRLIEMGKVESHKDPRRIIIDEFLTMGKNEKEDKK